MYKRDIIRYHVTEARREIGIFNILIIVFLCRGDLNYVLLELKGLSLLCIIHSALLHCKLKIHTSNPTRIDLIQK